MTCKYKPISSLHKSLSVWAFYHSNRNQARTNTAEITLEIGNFFHYVEFDVPPFLGVTQVSFTCVTVPPSNGPGILVFFTPGSSLESHFSSFQNVFFNPRLCLWSIRSQSSFSSVPSLYQPVFCFSSQMIAFNSLWSQICWLMCFVSLSSPAPLLGGKTLQCLEICHVLGPSSMPWHILLEIYRTAGAGASWEEGCSSLESSKSPQEDPQPLKPQK